MGVPVPQIQLQIAEVVEVVLPEQTIIHQIQRLRSWSGCPGLLCRRWFPKERSA